MSRYPNEPGCKEKGLTSEEAAVAMSGRAAYLRTRVLDTIGHFEAGLTADEVATLLDESVLSIRPRVSELAKENLVVRSGRRRPNASGMNAQVWIVNPMPEAVQ